MTTNATKSRTTTRKQKRSLEPVTDKQTRKRRQPSGKASSASAKPRRRSTSKSKAVAVAESDQRTFLNYLVPWSFQAPQLVSESKRKPKVINPLEGELQEVRRNSSDPEHLEYAFRRLHQEFNHREQQLEERLHEIKEHHQQLLQSKAQRRKWLLPIAIAGTVACSYMLYVLTSMQHSMTTMSGNITDMNAAMGAMAGDTRSMSQNMQYLNGNVTYMNQQMGALNHSVAPMGETAQATSPFVKMFRSFMPF